MLIILLYYRPIQCMQHNLSNGDTHSTEDLAISSLLEIDLRDQPDQTSWADHKKFAQLGTKKRVPQNNKMQHGKEKKSLKNSSLKQEEPTYIRPQYNPQMLQPNITEENVLKETRQDEEQAKQRQSKQKKFNEGEYWSSKVNWMSNCVRQQVRGQPKLSKKFSFGYEINFRQTWRGNSRYDLEQKTRNQEYKTNLIYSILSGEAEALRIRQLEERSKIISNKSCENSPRQILTKKQNSRYDNKVKEQNYNCIISKNLQQTMRKTLKKISARNYQEGPAFNQNPNNKQSEIQRAALVRQMLQNIELAKEKPPILESKQEKKEMKIETKHQQIVEDIMWPFVNQIQEIKKKSNVLNLNLQAQKVYKSKTVNRWNGRRIIQIVKAQ